MNIQVISRKTEKKLIPLHFKDFFFVYFLTICSTVWLGYQNTKNMCLVLSSFVVVVVHIFLWFFVCVTWLYAINIFYVSRVKVHKHRKFNRPEFTNGIPIFFLVFIERRAKKKTWKLRLFHFSFLINLPEMRNTFSLMCFVFSYVYTCRVLHVSHGTTIWQILCICRLWAYITIYSNSDTKRREKKPIGQNCE